MKKLVTLTTLLIASAIVSSADDSADEKRKRFRQEFERIPVPELPARAAEIVRKTPAAERSQAAIIAVETIAERHPAASTTAASAISKAAPETRAAVFAASTRFRNDRDNRNDRDRNNRNDWDRNDRDNDHQGPKPGNGNGNANGGVGHGVNKPGKIIFHDRPIKDTLPNGKPRHHPKDKPEKPPKDKCHQYNKPKHH